MRIQSENKATKSWFGFLVLHLIGWESGASFLDQSHNKLSKTNAIIIYFWHSVKNYSDLKKTWNT